MKQFLKGILLLLLGYLIFMLIAVQDRCMEAAKAALFLSADGVIPALFPFFVLSYLLIALGVPRVLGRYLSPLMRPLFGIPGSGALAVVLGLISGYPVGAETVKNLYLSGQCTKAEAERMLTFCNNSGPLFVVGTLGIGMLGNHHLGLLLYGIHLVSALLTGICFRTLGNEDSRHPALPPSAPEVSTASVLGEAVERGVVSVLKVCGFVVLFAVAGAVIPEFSGRAFLYGLLEITGGIHALLQSDASGNLLLPTVSMVLAFSGVSVLFQAAGILLPAGLSLKPYLLGKLLQGGFAFALTCLALRMFPDAVPVFSFQAELTPYGIRGISIFVVVLGVFLLIKKHPWTNSRDAEYRRLPETQFRQGLPWGHQRKNPSKTPQSDCPQTHGETV